MTTSRSKRSADTRDGPRRRDGRVPVSGKWPGAGWLNASAVALSIFVGAAHEHDSLVNLGKLVGEGEEAGIPVLAATAVGMPQGTWWDTNTRSPTFTRSTSSDLRPLVQSSAGRETERSLLLPNLTSLSSHV